MSRARRQHRGMNTGVPSSLISRRRRTSRAIGSVELAVGLWGVFALSHVVFNTAIGGSPILLSYTLAWAASGLILTLVLQRIIDWANPLPLAPRWLATVAATLAFVVVQTLMDEVIARFITPVVLGVFQPTQLVAEFLFRNEVGLRPVGVQITAWINFWVLACYPTASPLLPTPGRVQRPGRPRGRSTRP